MIAARSREMAKPPVQKVEVERLGKKPEFNPFWRQLVTRSPIQRKLTVSQPGDPYEQEADHVAEQVMRIPEATLQRVCEGCDTDNASCPQCEDEQESMLQRKAGETSSLINSSVPDHTIAHLGSGQPLDPATLAYMQMRFHRDFSAVRVHADTPAAESAQALHARAYTLGRDIVFGGGQYQPQAESGQRLLAHELTHVVQQHASRPMLQRQEKEEKPARVSVALVLDDSETTMATASALASRTLRVYSVEDMKTKLQGLGVPIDTLYVLSHSNRTGEVQFTGQSGGVSWAKLSEIATKLKGVLPADKAPVVIDFRGCQLGEAPEELGKVRQAVGASSAKATNCWTFDSKTTPLTSGGAPITEESQVTKENQAEFDKNLKQIIEQLKTEDGRAVKNCIIGLGAGEQADANFAKIKKLYFANKGRLVAQWVSPEYNQKWQDGSKCFKDLTKDENAKCRIVTAEAEIPVNEQTSETRMAEAETDEGAEQAATFEEEVA